MKLVVYKVDARKKDRRRFSKINIEKILFITFITTFTFMIIVQMLLISPTVGTFLTKSNQFEGTSLGLEEFLYKEGEIELTLQSIETQPDIRVLVNGDPVAVFTDKTLKLNVKEGDIIEIDGSNLLTEAEVAITTKSDNIKQECLDKKVIISTGVERLTEIKMN